MNHLKPYYDALPAGIKQTGRLEEEPAEIYLRAGQLKMMFRDGALRYISAGSDEIIRMIYAAVRGKNWITVKPVITDEKYDIKSDFFRIKYTSNFISEEIDFTARFDFEGNQDNSLVLTMEGIANKDFLKNRIGFCILHPIGNCAGNSCIIEHTDGSSESLSFPEEISPHQVFRNIKSMVWDASRTHCRLDFEGDIFETEDQRNWTDDSFKTYSTPLSIPFPVLIEKGTRIYQKVHFRTKRSFKITENQVDNTVVTLYPKEFFRLPSVGICQPDSSVPPGKEEIKVLRLLRFDHYRVDLHLYSVNWQLKAEQAYTESLDLGYPMEFALFIDDNAIEQIKDFITWYSNRKPSVSTILLLHKSLPAIPDQLAREVIPLLREIQPDIKIATGTNANFTQLNRNRPGETGNDCICYSIQPQEHAADNQTLIENLKGQDYTVKSARKFSGNKGIIISPVTLQRRFNANNTWFELPWSGPGVPPQIDSRMMSLLGASWTTGSLKYLCEAGAESVTFHYTTGERGIIQGASDSLWPSHFPSVKGMIFPVYYIFRYLLENKNLSVIKSISSKPLTIDCLSLGDGKEARIILVNFTGNVQSVKFHCCSGLFRIRPLNTDSFGEAASNYRWTGKEGEKTIQSDDTFKLEPYSINFIDGWMRN
jgi:D-apionolactonase